MDLYLGKLTPHAIATEIIGRLNEFNAGSRVLFENWLFGRGGDYKLLTVSDGSVWTIRLGKNEKRYIHIHPGRHSPNTLRVKALTLKTAIIAAISGNENNLLNLEFINGIRVSILNASPLKSVSSTSGLGKIINILMEEGG